MVHARVGVSFTNCSDTWISKYDAFVIAKGQTSQSVFDEIRFVNLIRITLAHLKRNYADACTRIFASARPLRVSIAHAYILSVIKWIGMVRQNKLIHLSLIT